MFLRRLAIYHKTYLDVVTLVAPVDQSQSSDIEGFDVAQRPHGQHITALIGKTGGGPQDFLNSQRTNFPWLRVLARPLFDLLQSFFHGFRVFEGLLESI